MTLSLTFAPVNQNILAWMTLHFAILHHCISSVLSCNVSFWFSFADCVLVYKYAYVFVRLCLDVYVMRVVLLRIGHDSHYAVSSTHWAAPQHTLGPPVL